MHPPLTHPSWLGPERPGAWARGIEWSCAAMAVLAGLLFLAEALMAVGSVLGRTLLGWPVPGDYELVQMMSAMGVALCLPFCQLRRGHVFVDFFTAWAPGGVKRVLDALAALLLAALAFVLAWRSALGLLEMRRYGEASMVLALPVWWAYVPLVPAFGLLGLTALHTLQRDWRGARVRA